MVSNHLDLRAMVEREGIRFIHLPVTKDTKAQQEQRLLEIVDETGPSWWCLARYMQILSNESVGRNCPAAASIFTTLFCPDLKAPSPTIKPMNEA